jgi:hypothetical protein
MSVPEAAMYEDDFAMTGENNVRATGKIFAVKSKAVATLMQNGTHSKLSMSVFAADATHKQ